MHKISTDNDIITPRDKSKQFFTLLTTVLLKLLPVPLVPDASNTEYYPWSNNVLDHSATSLERC